MIKPIFKTNAFNEKIIYQFKLKNLKNKILKLTTKSYQQALPLVAVPLIAYNVQTDAKSRGKAIVLEHGKANHPVTDNTEKNIKALKNAGYKNADINRELDKNGNLKNESTKKAISCKGAPDDLDAQPAEIGGDYVGDMPEVYDNEVPDDIPMPEDMPSTDDIAELTDVEGLGDAIDAIPVAGAVVAEALPGTRFLKPLKDLCKGDVEKAVVGTLSRATETLIAPFKLGFAGGMGIFGGLLKLGGVNDDYAGFWNGIKQASQNWAKARDAIEDKILGRETKSERIERLKEERRKKLKEREEKIKQREKARQERAEAFRRKRLEEMQAAVASTQKEVLADDKQTSRAKRREELRKQKIEEEKRLLAEKEKERELAIERMNEANKGRVEKTMSEENPFKRAISSVMDNKQMSRAQKRETIRNLKIEEEKRLLAEKEKERELAVERMKEAEKHPVEEISSNCTISAPKEDDSIPDELIEALCDRALPLMQLAKRIKVYSELNRNFDFDEFVKETGFYDTNLEDFSVEEINRIRKILDERIKALKK